jgi:hypothetical protein
MVQGGLRHRDDGASASSRMTGAKADSVPRQVAYGSVIGPVDSLMLELWNKIHPMRPH